MNASEIISIFRQRADDAVFPYHVSDETLLGFCAEAEAEAAIRAKLIHDETSDICKFPLVAGVARYDLDPCIIEITDMRYVNLDGAIFGMTRCGIETFLDSGMNVQGRPYRYGFVAENTIGVWPAPNAYHTGEFQVSVYRTPIYPIEELEDDFEIGESHQQYLVDWLLYRVYMSKDSELYDPKRSAEAYSDFVTRFGDRRSADVRRRHREKRPVTVPYSGY